MRQDNSFDLLRFLAATAVIFSHSYAMTGNYEFGLLGDSIGGWGVNIFFVISGYLLAGTEDFSWNYFWKRSLRLFPALAVSTIITVLVIGPLITTLSISEYIHSSETWLFLASLGLFGGGSLPGVFTNNPFPLAVNGSLWTLPFFFIMYICLYIYGRTGLLRNRTAIFLLYISIWPLVILSPQIPLPNIISTVPMVSSIFKIVLSWHCWHWYLYFFGGVLLYIYRDIVKLNRTKSMFCLGALIPTYYLGLKEMMYLLLPLMIIAFALYKNEILNNCGKYGDFSYGMYIYAFPIQQTISFFLPGIVSLRMFAYSFVITIAFAIISWNLIEKQSLVLKNKFNRDYRTQCAEAPT